MNKRLIFVVMVVVALVLVGLVAGSGLFEGGRQAASGSLGMPVPGFEGTPEMIVGDEEDGGAVSSGMPVPGFENVPEMIVIEE
jgi:hypothetical protein